MPGPFDYSERLVNTEQVAEYTAYAGADIVAYMGKARMATLQGVTIQITREVLPLYTFGSPSPKGFVKGKRAIAGNLVFTQFDRHAILKMTNAFREYKTLDQLWAQYGNSKIPSSNETESSVVGIWGNVAGLDSSAVFSSAYLNVLNENLKQAKAEVGKRQLKFADQIPPFDVTITLVNEQGLSSYAAVHGLQLINEGYGWTLDDLTSETAYTYIARDITPLDVVKFG